MSETNEDRPFGAALQRKAPSSRTTTGFSDILKVSAKSNPNSVAGALAGALRQRGSAELQSIGAGALNQAIKAVAIARGFVAPSGMDLICVPAFTEIQINGEVRTAIRVIVELR